jgi:hypothetical protein
VWIVKASWLDALVSAGDRAVEAPHEAEEWFPGARKARRAREEGSRGLLDGKRFAIVGKSAMPAPQLQGLLEAAGAQIVRSPKDADYVICPFPPAASQDAPSAKFLTLERFLDAFIRFELP